MKDKIPGRWIWAFLLTLAVLHQSCKEDSYKATFEEKYGTQSFDLVNKSKRISYFEVDPYYEDTTAVSMVGDYAIVGEMIPLERLDKKKIQNLLTDYKSYSSEGLNWACNFAPTYGFRFLRKGELAYLLVSPSCDKAKFITKDGEESKFIDYSLLIAELGEIIKKQ